jgi:DNA-binding LacI/PurR family transcriptional regulator
VIKNILTNADLKRPINRRVYQRDIAERARVSISTVSRVLKNVGGISESVAQRVLAAAEELGYETIDDDKSEQLRNVMLLTSLSLSPSLDPFHADVLSGVEWACHQQEIHFSYASFSNSGSNAELVLSRLQRNPVDGVLLLSLDDPALLEQVRALNVPLVMLNVDALDPVEDAVLPDNYQGARLAMRHLLANGHTRILHITQSHRRTIQRRTEAYKDMLWEAGIAFDPDLVIETEINAEQTYKVMTQRLAQRGADYTAVFCANDLSAMGFMRAAQEYGLSIPNDISVIGFDDISSVAFLSPPLTTIRIDVRQLAAQAVRRLMDRVADPSLLPIRVFLGCELVERYTVVPR